MISQLGVHFIALVNIYSDFFFSGEKESCFVFKKGKEMKLVVLIFFALYEKATLTIKK